MIGGKWSYSEGNYTDERCDNGDYTGWVKSSFLSPLLCRCRRLSRQFGWVRSRHCRKRAGSVAAAE